ncbi:MAG: nicotinate (nicotinamide) nucleotide adenylyltransferase [Verrucomicrobiota bacterium]
MRTPLQRIGLFGGSFDPVHLGHLLVAHAACEEFALDRLFFIVAARAPLKVNDHSAPAEVRARLLRLALAGQPHFEIDEQEIARGGVSYTIDTVNNYRARFPEASLCYLIGADHLSLLPKWRAAEELAACVEFLVIPRPGQTVATLPPPFRGRVLQGFPCGISSSQIRARIKAGQPVDFLVPPAVAENIRNNRLYL